MNYDKIIILLFLFLMIIILSYEIFFHSIYLIKNIIKMDKVKRKSKLIEIAINSFIMGIVFTICFICIIGWISIFIILIYFSIGAFLGALISLEQPRPSIREIYHD